MTCTKNYFFNYSNGIIALIFFYNCPYFSLLQPPPCKLRNFASPLHKGRHSFHPQFVFSLLYLFLVSNLRVYGSFLLGYPCFQLVIFSLPRLVSFLSVVPLFSNYLRVHKRDSPYHQLGNGRLLVLLGTSSLVDNLFKNQSVWYSLSNFGFLSSNNQTNLLVSWVPLLFQKPIFHTKLL